MSDSNVEKRHAPTDERLRQARERGEVPHASDTVAAAAVVGVVLTLLASAAVFRDRFGLLLDRLIMLTRLRDDGRTPSLALRTMGQDVFLLLVPVSVISVLVAILVAFAVTGPVWSAKPLAPQFMRINPFEGLKRIVSVQTAFSLLKGLVTVALLTAVVVGLLWSWPARLASIWRSAPMDALASLATLLGVLVVILAVASLLASLPDLWFQRWSFRRGHRMDDAELRRESKDQEGDPHQKAARRSQHRALQDRT